MKLHRFTFIDTGVEVLLRKVPPFAADDIRRSWESRKPKPPVIPTEIAGMHVEEANYDDPDYIAELEVWQRAMGEAVNMFYIRRGVYKIMNDDWQGLVDEYRAEMAEYEGVELPKDDMMLYLSRIACGTAHGLQELYQAIIARSQPTEEVVQRYVDNFRSDVSG